MHRLLMFATLAAVAAVVVACSGGGAATVSPSATNSPTSSDEADTRIGVTLTDALRMEPAAFSVPAGVPVTFVVTNAGSADHEFYLGDEAAQAAHEEEMASLGGMTHDEPEGIAVGPGETKELTYTFAGPESMVAGCHLPGHYAGGMKADITVEG